MENVYQYALKQGNNTTYNFKPCYQNIKKYISDHDLAYINQKTLIAGDSYGIKGYHNFNSPESLIDDLQDTGFNMASSATNHSMDNIVSYCNKGNSRVGCVFFIFFMYCSRLDRSRIIRKYKIKK